MNEAELTVAHLRLLDDERVLSPPVVVGPNARGRAVTVLGFAPHADVQLQIDGDVLDAQPAGFPDPDGCVLGIEPLAAGQVVRARQILDGVASEWSPGVTVKDHTQDFPAGPPRPEIRPAPASEWGSRTGVRNLLSGSRVWITADGHEAGRVKGAKMHQSVNVNPDYGLDQRVRAWAALGEDLSPPSQEYVTQPPPTPLPTPAIDATYQGGELIRVTNLVAGARITVARGGMTFGPYRTTGNAHLASLHPPLAAGEPVEVTQRMDPGQPSSAPAETVVLPCAALPAPEAAPIPAGDGVVHLNKWVPGARIRIYAGRDKIGDGGGPLIALIRPVQRGERVYIRQTLGACESPTARFIDVLCVAPHVGEDPAGLNLFPVGYKDYAEGDTRGSVYYPAQEDGENQAFNDRWSALGRSPIVFLAHGNHHTHHDPADRYREGSPTCPNGVPVDWIEIPNHKGYDYFQKLLARMGVIAVSVNANTVGGCVGASKNDTRNRAELIMASIEHFKALDSSDDDTFGNRIDFERVALMGHSRGGEAVVLVGNQAPDRLGVNIRAVLSLAPIKHDMWTPDGYAFMTIVPANDGDVRSIKGLRFYDIAEPHPLKSQIFVDWANHNYFNRQWLLDESGRVPPAILTRDECERILGSYGCAFFRAFLLNHGTIGYLTYQRLPPGVNTSNVHLSFERGGQLTVDDHEQDGTIDVNTLGQPTNQSEGMDAAEYYLGRATPTSHPSDSFWHETVGMVMASRPGEVFRSQLGRTRALTGPHHAIWVRVAEVSNRTPNPFGAVHFDLGLEDTEGNRAWAASREAGGVPRPFDQAPLPEGPKSVLSTLRFPIVCFQPDEGRFDAGVVRAILIRYWGPAGRSVAFDVLQVVQE